MPNYRKKNNNYRNKNKNKNKNTSSSSVKQEHRIVETTTTVITSGNEPNLPADDRNSCTTSANKSVFEEKNVVVVVNVDESSSISPLSNEEIDANACNVDIDTFSGSEDRNTAQKQSNYSSTFYSSSSKKSTEIEHRQSGRTILDSRDSTLGNSVIRDTLVEEASSGKNSFKTGSANTKDTAVPAADTSSATATQSIESTRINESVSKNVRDSPEKRSQSAECATEVIETDNRLSHNLSKEEDHSSKVIVHTVIVKNGSEKTEEQSTSIHKTPSENSSKVIVHQISKEDPSIHEPKSHVIIHREEQSSSTSQRASKNGVDLSKKVISKQVSKKKAIRTNTSSLQTSTKAAESSTTQTLSFSNVRGQPSREIVYEVFNPKSPRKVILDPFSSGHGPSRAIIHQISKEEGLETVAQDSSKVIVHQISREEKERTSSTSETVLTQHILPQTTEHKVIIHQTSPSKNRGNSSDTSKSSSPKPTGIFDQSSKLFDHSTFQHGFEKNISKKSGLDQKDGFEQHKSKNETLSEWAGLHQPDSFAQAEPSDLHKKVIIIPILQENSTQTSPLPSFSENPLHSNLLEIIQDESSQPKSSSDQENYRQTSASPLSRSPVICFENLSESFELQKDQTEESSGTAENLEASSQTSSPETLQEKITKEIERPIVQEDSTEIIPLKATSKPSRKSPQIAEQLEPLKIPSFPVNRPSKVIIHPILHDASMKPTFPFSEKSIKSLDSSSKKMANQILKEVSSELKSSFLTENNKKEVKEVSIEKVKTSFPISLKSQETLRPGFFETNTFETEINPLDSESKVILHQILKEEPISSDSKPQTKDLHYSNSKSNHDEKVVVHQISREEIESSKSYQASKGHINKEPNVKVITHQISREESNASEQRGKPITPTLGQINNEGRTPTNLEESKVIVHQILQENLNSNQSESKTTKTISESTPKPVLDEEKPKVILHQISREETPLCRSPSFPMANSIKREPIQKDLPSSNESRTPSTNSFPLSSLKIHHPEQYNSKSTVLEQKTINCQTLRDKSKFKQSSSTLTSPFSLPMMTEEKGQGNSKVINHPILHPDFKPSESSLLTSSQSEFPISAKKQKQSKFTTHPIFSDTSKTLESSFPVSSGSSFPLSKEKEIHATQYFRPQDRLQQTIDLQSLRNSSEFRQSSSTMTSTYGTTEMGKAKDQPQEIIHHISKEESSKDDQSQDFQQQSLQNESVNVSKESVLSDFETSSTSAFPTSNVKEIHHIQYSRPQDRLQETIDLQSLRDSSDFRQSSSTMTSTFGLTEMGSKKDQPEAKEIVHKIVKEESSSDLQPQSVDLQTSLSEETTKQFIPSDSSFPLSNDKEIHATQYLRPQDCQQKSINLQSLRESSELRQSSSTISSTFGLTEIVNTEDQPKSSVIIHKIVKEESSNDHQPQGLDHQTSQDGSVSSSEGSVITAIRNDSPRSLSPPEADAQKINEPSKVKAPKSSFFLTPLELPKENQTESSEVKQDPVKTINHPIVRQLDKPLGYRVESPQPEKVLMITKKSKSFDDDDVVIQEMSDTSSAGDTDNPPVISEAESETDTLEAVDDFPDTPTSSLLLSVQTLPIDHEDDSLSPKSSQDYKIRRQQNRAALESHFLPQFLAPNFLDSIKEENSDLSDSERRSSCSDRIDPPVQHTDLDDDVFLDPPKKANAVYPKSNLDFSKKHKHVLNVRPPKTSVIREEAPAPSVVEAKIVDQGSIEESCSSWSTDITPESEAAEVVYIDSASSSVSDLLELDYSQGQSDDSMDVRIQTPTIDLDSVNEMFATCQPVENNDRRIYTPPPEKPPPQPLVKEDEIMNERNLSPSHSKNDVREITKQIPEEELRKNFDEIILEKIETMSEAAIDTHRNADDVSIASAAAADRAENSIANNLNSCDSAINQVTTSNTTSSPSVSAVGSIKNMENIREIVNASTSASSSNEKSELDTITDTADHGISKPNFMIGKPCSDHTLKCDTTSSTTSSSSSSSTTTTTTTTNITERNILTLHDLCQTLDDTKYLNNPLVSPSSSALGRQESFDSHGSDQSHSTSQSQCTAINQGSLPHCDWNEFDTTTDTTYVSESDTAAGLASSEASSPLTTKGGQTSGDETDTPPIRKLRSLCTEALASMPYGEEVLEELATVAQNIREMPYPLPELPQIQDIQLSLGSQPEKSSVITLSQVPPRPAQLGQKFKSPPPPPVPEPPSKYDSWLGVPTESDPNVLVCLSPSQRNAVKSDSTADGLLDMHKKFVERRGYHEYTTKQVSAMNQANTSEAQKLNKIDSPPPPPLPPRPPVQSSNPNGNTDKDDDEEDQNNHRLLAIIRDTHENQQQQHHQQKSSMTSTSENISRRTEGGTHNTVNTNSKNGGGGCLEEEFANLPSSVSKQSQERKFDSESNKSHSEMQQSQSEHSTKIGSEPVMGMQFPTSDYFDSIFAGTNKRLSNIETVSSPGFCSQILATQPKRYSNIETSSFESKKFVENGKVLYDVSDSKREKISEGDQPDSSAGLTTSFPELSKTKTNDASGNFPFVATPNQSAMADSRPQKSGDSENIMSAFNLNTKPQATAPPAVVNRVESSPPAPPVPPLPPTFTADTTATSSTTTTKSTSKSESLINRTFNGKTDEKTFDDFRQHAKEAAAGSSNESTTKKTSDAFQHEKLFKDFDDLSNLLKDELESGKRRPPATLDGSDIPSNVSDYNRMARESRIQSSHVSSTTSTETNRREQMKKLADEIDQTSKQRQQHRREMRIPIKIEKSVGTGPRSAPELPQQPKSYDIPVRVENGHGSRPTLHHQRSYEIPIRVEQSNSSRQRTHSEHQSQHATHEIPIQVEKPQPERFRRAESMFNISDTTSSRPHLHHDDWMKYVGDLGSSENICKPFQREVEICYLGRRPNIRAPRMSASTSDLSSIHSYDTHGAYDVRRTTQTPRPQQPPRRAYLSTQSMIDTTPITPCVSSRRSPAPERRSSLPREIHDKQLKYITSKEQQLKYEFERLENERRQLIDEMNRAQINQRINREAYRQRQLPPLTEDESFRQQMAEEWLDKVAEREERRLQKIIKISKINQEAGIPVAPPRRHSAADDIGDEFLRRVKERRSKLCMPSDSDWESGAESQPLPRTDGSRSENEEPPVTVFEGQSATNIKQLPKHLREFAKLTSQSKQEHREEVTENSSSSATKKTSVMTTVKTSSNNNSTHESKSMQQDAAHVRDLEQLSHSQHQGKRPKLVTILRHKKPAESCGSGSGGANSSCQQTAAGTGAPATSGSGNNANSAIKRRKQTRFLLTPNRRSWSESDLLREIDKELVLAKGFLYANESIDMFAPKFKATAPPSSGVWTPKNQTPTSSRTNLNDFQPHNNNNNRSPTNSSPLKTRSSENRSSSACGRNQKGIPTPPPPPLWTPQPERKQFRPVHFESPTLQRRYVRQQSSSSEVPSPPWSYTNSQPFPGYQSQSSTNPGQKDTAISWPPPPSSSSKEPPASAPTAIVNDPVVVEVEDDIDVDEGFAPTTSIAEKIRSFERSNSNFELHRPLVRHNPHEKPAIIRPNEVIFSLKNEYMSEPETEYDKPKKMAQLSRRQYDGIGPTTKHGMPVILRSEVKEPNQHEWYKRIFQTIHKQKNPDDYVTIRYKCPRGRYPYKSNGYMSEPEPNYDSDYSAVKYRTLERRRLQSTGTGTESRTSARTGNESQDETFYGTMPNPVKSGQGSYKVQPGRIENYITGHSSVSEKEKKEWWDEVMDIFNGQLDQQKLSPHYTEGNLSRALLKEQGYTSDSNLVFRKKDVPILQSPLSPVEQKQVYKSVQAGGQPPLLGFRKPAPEKPKETEFEYLPITPTLTKIRVHSKELVMSKNHQAAERGELICYPITNIARPIDVFAPFPKNVPSFIPLHQAPMPPNRKSSRTRTNSMGLIISSSQVRRPTSANSSRHEACFQTKDAISPPPPKPTKYGTITLRKPVKHTEPLMRSKSAGAVVSILTTAKEEKTRDERISRKQQSVRLSSCSPVRNASRLSTLRGTSRSPVAFGRSVSKERSFAEEKKRIEESLPSVRTDFTASTNILRDPRLKSPDQVKRAVRSYAFPIERSKSAPRVLPMIKPAMSSYVSTYVIRRIPSPSRKDVTKRNQASSPTRSLVRPPAVFRSKSQSSKLSEKTSSKPLAKTCSTVSLARTSSTFSVDSIGSKVKPPLQKKTLTISRPSSKVESEKPKRKPVTICSSKSDSNVLKKIKESPEMKKKIIKAIPNQQKIVRTNHFFQNLFMRDTSPKRVEPVRQTAVQEKTRYWNTMTLPPKKSICDSRTITYRSLSPPAKPHFIQEYESVEHFHSEDECSEFGDRSGRTEDLVWQYEQKSLSEPRPVKSLKPVSDIARPESPARTCTREFSPTREIRVPQTREMRSPSRRRIENFRDSQRGETGKVIRASSLSSADDRSKRSLYNCDDFSHSANSLDYIERHSPSCRFSNSDRFIDLNRFYNTLERVGQLERATSASSLKPIRKDGEPLDFEEWRKIRFHERAERELSYLVGKLKEDQKEKDFLFRPKDVEDVKWVGNRDLSLKSKEKSVEDLRENFEKKIQQEWLDENKRLELESKKDTYKPYWRGSSVADLASNMEIKYNPESGSYGVKKTKSEVAQDKPLCLSNRLISTLSKDQVTKITQQLNEIYNASEPRTKPDVSEKYVITVDKQTPVNALKVRCNSSISKEELIGPVLRKKEASEKHVPSKKIDDRRSREIQSELSESEKKRLSQNFCREIQGKARSSSPNIVGRETRGAIAAENAKMTPHEIPKPPPLPKDLIEVRKAAPPKPKRKTTEDLQIETEKPSEEQAPETEHLSVETTIDTPDETVSKKIQYFEERKFKESPKTIYHAREDSSPDEDEIMRVIEANIKARAQSGKYHHQEMSSSVTDLKDLFGEKESSRINFPIPRPPPPPDETVYHETKKNQNQSTSLTLCTSRVGSIEDLETLFRSRSISPQSKEISYLHRVNTGEVQKIKDKFESLGRPKKKKHFFALSPLRKVRSDPELSNDGSKDTFKTTVHEHELGDVSWIAQKFEVRQSSGRGRSRVRKSGSPIQRSPLRKEDRLMPHIDIISKTASLKQEMIKSRSPSPARQQATLHAGEVERIRCIFETSPDRTSPVGQPRLGTSSPDLRDISPHLTASWIAHKFPRPLDNDLRSPPPPLPSSPPPPLQPKKLAKSDSLPIKEARHHEHCYRSRSISPPKSKKKHQVISILKPRFDFFANQKFDPLIHRPKATYVPDSGDDGLKKSSQSGAKKMPAVKFKDDDDDVPTPPVPPTKGVPLPLDLNNGSNNPESPNRYFESDVNIHYKTPIRYEYKDPIPEEELAIRQAETMQKLYQEERRRKYLQELQDMTSRRHTDNFTPSQKSPIPLNRYDDFKSDLAPKSPSTSNYPRTVARALYNFQGQTARELTFKKGDVIYIRRQIDKNWYEGEHNAMIGLLPSNYVELLSKDGIRQPPKKPSEGQARAKYNFQAQSGIELSLNKGEHVTLTRRVDENWYEGKIANRKGIFPVSYVEVLVDIGAEDRAGRLPVTQSIITQSSSSMRPSLDTLRTNINNEFNSLTSNGQPPNGILRETRTLHKTEVLHVDTNTEPVAYRALYKYRPQNTDELELQEGDIVFVLEKCDDGWFVGTSQRSGCFGTFPGNYVERV